MAAYNESENIGNAIRSVQAQTFRNWELIAIDDASSDETLDNLRKLAALDERIQVYSNECNMGLAASLNRAIKLCSYPLIARMDADDICMPNRFDIQIGFMSANPHIDVLGSACIEIDENLQTLGVVSRYEFHNKIIANAYKICPFIHPTVMFRKDFIMSMNGYDESLKRCQDLDLWLRGRKTYQYHNLKIALIYYKRRKFLRWRDAKYASWVLYISLRRERSLARYFWIPLRPVVAYFYNLVRNLA